VLQKKKNLKPLWYTPIISALWKLRQKEGLVVRAKCALHSEIPSFDKLKKRK
jgi:hypothetical protein